MQLIFSGDHNAISCYIFPAPCSACVVKLSNFSLKGCYFGSAQPKALKLAVPKLPPISRGGITFGVEFRVPDFQVKWGKCSSVRVGHERGISWHFLFEAQMGENPFRNAGGVGRPRPGRQASFTRRALGNLLLQQTKGRKNEGKRMLMFATLFLHFMNN